MWFQEQRSIAEKPRVTHLKVKGTNQEAQQIVDIMRSLDLINIKGEITSHPSKLVNLIANELVLQLNESMINL